MKYDFTTVVSRKNTGAMKWDEIATSTGEKPDVIPLSVADMEFKACPEIVEGIKEAADKGIFGYTYCPPGYMDAVVGWMKDMHQWDIKPEWVEQTWGVVLALYNAIRAFTNEGDGVLIQTPVYYPFFSAIRDNKRRVVENPLKVVDGKYVMDYEDLEEKAKDAKLMILCSPHNPAGRVWSKEELDKLGEICLKNHVMVISDEIHSDIIMPGYHHTVFASVNPEFADHCMVCTSPSKTFNLAGLNLANIIIKNPDLMKQYKKTCLESATDYNSFFGYAACKAGYTKGREWLKEMIETVYDNYKYLVQFMQENYPQTKVYDLEGTYLAWVDVRSFGMEAKELETFMTDKAWLFLDQGYLFGKQGEGFVRFNLACPKTVLQEALLRMKKALDER